MRLSLGLLPFVLVSCASLNHPKSRLSSQTIMPEARYLPLDAKPVDAVYTHDNSVYYLDAEYSLHMFNAMTIKPTHEKVKLDGPYKRILTAQNHDRELFLLKEKSPGEWQMAVFDLNKFKVSAEKDSTSIKVDKNSTSTKLGNDHYLSIVNGNTVELFKISEELVLLKSAKVTSPDPIFNAALVDENKLLISSSSKTGIADLDKSLKKESEVKISSCKSINDEGDFYVSVFDGMGFAIKGPHVRMFDLADQQVQNFHIKPMALGFEAEPTPEEAEALGPARILSFEKETKRALIFYAGAQKIIETFL